MKRKKNTPQTTKRLFSNDQFANTKCHPANHFVPTEQDWVYAMPCPQHNFISSPLFFLSLPFISSAIFIQLISIQACDLNLASSISYFLFLESDIFPLFLFLCNWHVNSPLFFLSLFGSNTKNKFKGKVTSIVLSLKLLKKKKNAIIFFDDDGRENLEN